MKPWNICPEQKLSGGRYSLNFVYAPTVKLLEPLLHLFWEDRKSFTLGKVILKTCFNKIDCAVLFTLEFWWVLHHHSRNRNAEQHFCKQMHNNFFCNCECSYSSSACTYRLDHSCCPLQFWMNWSLST